MYGIVYMTICLINGRKYIGQHKCKNVNDRYLGSGTILKMAIKKFGAENFVRQTLCVCESEEELNQKEIEYIAKYNATESLDFYNICEGGKANRMTGEMNPMYGMRGELAPGYGRKISDEERQRRSESMRGEKNPLYGHVYTEEERKKFGRKGEAHWNYGRHWSEEVKKKMSNAKKGKPSPIKGVPKTEETKKKISEAKKGKASDLSEEGRKRISEATTKRNKTEVFKNQVSEANRQFHEAGGRRGNKPVVCVETGIVYVSCYDASRAIGCGLSSISACISGSCKTVKGFHWRFATEEEAKQAVIA